MEEQFQVRRREALPLIGDGGGADEVREAEEVVGGYLFAHALQQVSDAAAAGKGIQSGVEV